MTDSPVAFDLRTAADDLQRIALAVADDQLDLPTPCADWPVRALLAHTCGLSIAFTATARKESLPRPDDAAPLAPDWRETLPGDLDALVAAWRDPAAWEGMSEAGGVTMPAAELAAVAMNELTLHAWDLAVATGQDWRPDATQLAVCTGFAEAMSTPEAAASRDGLFGPVVALPDDADPRTRLLALTGRDPHRRP